MRHTLLAVCLFIAAAAHAQPRLSNGRLETHSAAAGVEPTARALVRTASSPTWIGWSVPTDRAREMCCWDASNDGRCCAGCRLEGRGPTTSSEPDGSGAVRLEPPHEMYVLLRAEAGEATKIRTVSATCPLDGGGATLHWLESVRAGDSVAFLASFLDGTNRAREARRLGDHALAALALHAEPAALDTLIDRAKHGEASHLRGQALFWLAQRAGDKAVRAIAAALADDPETDVKKKAVFALSQLPSDEGVPLLIQTARANKNPAVRKQAFFWLGQSKDPRALAFFEEVLR